MAESKSRLTPLGRRAKELCEEFPDAPSKTLARRLAKELSVAIEVARSAIRRQFGVGGSARQTPSVPREKRAPGQMAGLPLQMPKSHTKTRIPFDLGTNLGIGVIGDLHVPYHADIAVEVAVDHFRRKARKKLDVILINGDLGDFYQASRFDHDPDMDSLLDEIEQIREMLGWLRRKFPTQRIVWKYGNHDDRWALWLHRTAPEIGNHPRMELSEWCECERLKIEIVKDKRKILAGRLPIYHGHEIGQGNSVNAARRLWTKITHSGVTNHWHSTSQHTVTDTFKENHVCWSVGCLCELDPLYAPENSWNWGFFELDVDAGGGFAGQNWRIGLDGELYR